MLNPNTNIRELAYIVKIDEIRDIEGVNNQVAVVNGWTVFVKRDQFKAGDLAVYFEIDSKVPKLECFSFLEKYGYKVKTQKFVKGLVISQGLLIEPEAVGITKYKLGDFLTEKLGVTYYEAEDNVRKADNNKYTSMRDRHKKFFKTKFGKWLMRHEFTRKICFFFLGKKKDKKTDWPTGKFPGVSKTDQERCENMPWILKDKSPYIKTLKIDGTSATYILERIGKNKFEYYVCSRNVRMASRDQKNYHSTEENIYWDASDKYKIREFLEDYLNKNNLDWVCLQGEIAGTSLKGTKIQGDPHNLNIFKFYGFHMTDSKNGRLGQLDAKEICNTWGIEWVPILDDNYIMPDDFEEFKLSADGKCDLPNSKGLREGFVYYKKSDPTFSFKNVSREYLFKNKN